jgi:hypothetical protein
MECVWGYKLVEGDVRARGGRCEQECECLSGR